MERLGKLTRITKVIFIINEAIGSLKFDGSRFTIFNQVENKISICIQIKETNKKSMVFVF